MNEPRDAALRGRRVAVLVFYALVASLLGACGSDEPGVEPVCEAGFVEVGGVCQDLDECATGAHTCSGRATCVNREGSFSCACPPGWQNVGGSCQIAACKFRYQQGHGDLYVSWSEARGLSTALRTELSPGAGERLHATSEVCIDVPHASYDEVVELGGRPPEEEWAPLGVAAGEPFWYLPEIAIEGRPWFGVASDPGALGGVPVDQMGPMMSLAIQVDAPPGGALSMWVTGATGGASFLLSTASGLSSAEIITASHAHMSWGFTKPGEYLVDATVSGIRPGGQRVTSAPSTLRFVVR